MFNTEDEILRRLQEKNLEMAVMFYHWCQRNHLTCYLCGGGCIGAIRHGGFIPWDDDLDFFMPRKDYEKFLKIWDTQEESKIYKLEYPKEGFCNAHTFANIRDSRTTQVKKEQVDMDLCHGVALDILPIEGYAPGNLARKWQVIEGKIFQLFCTQVIPTKERHGAFMHYLGTILLALAPTQKMRYRIWKQAENYITKFDIDSHGWTASPRCAHRRRFSGNIRKRFLHRRLRFRSRTSACRFRSDMTHICAWRSAII